MKADGATAAAADSLAGAEASTTLPSPLLCVWLSVVGVGGGGGHLLIGGARECPLPCRPSFSHSEKNNGIC
jgi:hypothetical protein